MINNIFWDLIVENIMMVYLDDILIFTQILEEYHKVVYRVLEILAKHKLFLYSKKCKLDKLYIKYFCLVISVDQVEIDSIKIARVCDWSILTIYIDMQVFLSFTNFYWRFTHSFLDIICLLLNITDSNSTWTWNSV